MQKLMATYKMSNYITYSLSLKLRNEMGYSSMIWDVLQCLFSYGMTDGFFY